MRVIIACATRCSRSDDSGWIVGKPSLIGMRGSARNSGEIDKVEGRARWIADGEVWTPLVTSSYELSLVSWVPSPASRTLLPSWSLILMLAVSLVLPDSRIPLAGVQRCFLEILGIGWKNITQVSICSRDRV